MSDDEDEMDDDETENGSEDSETSEPSKPKPKLLRFGCMPYLILIGAGLLGSGIYLMGRWDAMNGSAKAGTIVLIVFGTIVLLPVVLYYVLVVVINHFFKKLTKDMGGAMKGMFDLNKKIYGSVHEFRPAEEEDFEDVDRSYYETNTTTLTGRGFRHLGDVVDQTIEDTMDFGAPIRVFSSPDGTTQVAIFDMSNAGGDEPMLICDVQTEFSDGTFLATSNTEAADLITPPPRVRKRQHPRSTAVTELIQRHESEKQKVMAAAPALSCIASNTLAEALASEKRLQQAKNEHRKEIGYVDPDEVRRIAEKSDIDPQVTDWVAGTVEEQRKREQDDEA